MTEAATNTIALSYQSLPDSVKDWLSSELITFAIGGINDRLGLKQEKRRIIPRMILRLATQDIDPVDFINELSHEMGITFQTAKSIAEDIEAKALRPIEAELRNGVGVDIKLIYFGQPGPRKTTPEPESETPKIIKQEPAKIEIQPEIKTAEPIPVKTEPAPIEIKTEQKPVEAKIAPAISEELPATPFIIHQEETVKPTAPRFDTGRPTLNIEVKSFLQEKPAAPKPVSVRLEATEPQQNVRVVHYNNLKTPLTSLGSEKKPLPKKQDMINLQNFTKVEGNSVDLRKE